MALSDYDETCVLMERKQSPDGIGGSTVIWVEGIEFQAAITQPSNYRQGETRVAEAQTVEPQYTVIISKNIPIVYQSIFKRISDGEYFRVTSDPHNKETPKRARLQFMQCSAEKLKALPDTTNQKGELYAKFTESVF